MIRRTTTTFQYYMGFAPGMSNRFKGRHQQTQFVVSVAVPAHLIQCPGDHHRPLVGQNTSFPLLCLRMVSRHGGALCAESTRESGLAAYQL